MFDNPFLVLNSTAVVDFFYKLETQSSSAFWLAKHCRDESVSLSLLNNQLWSIINNRHTPLTYAVRTLGTKEIESNIEFQVIFFSHASHSFVAFNVTVHLDVVQ